MEIESLQNQLREQSEAWKAKETRLMLAQDRLKKKVVDLEKRNKELSDEVIVLERERSSLLEVRINNNLTQMPKAKSVDSLPANNRIRAVPRSLSEQKLLHSKEYIPSLKGINSIKSTKPLVTKFGALVLDPSPSAEVITEPKKSLEVDPAKADLDQLQKELGFERFIKVLISSDFSKSI